MFCRGRFIVLASALDIPSVFVAVLCIPLKAFLSFDVSTSHFKEMSVAILSF